MKITFKSKEEIEDVALRTLRNSNDKTLLNNRNVNCFVMGWEHAVSDFEEQIMEQREDDFKAYLEEMIAYCTERYRSLEMDLGYAGYQFSRPESADAMFKLYGNMMKCCDFLVENLENVKMCYSDYYEKLKGGN